MAVWDTASNVLNQAAKELKLIAVSLEDPYASTDPNIIQLCALLTAVGQDLVRDFTWSHLVKTNEFSANVGLDVWDEYDLPDDFARFTNGTFWNRSGTRQILGPYNAQQWQQAISTSSGAVSQVFRITGDKLLLYPVSSGSETYSYEYGSSYWVKPTGQTEPTTEAPSAKTDTLYLEKRLLTCALKLAWLQENGFPSDAAQMAYESALSRAQGNDGAAPVLSLNGGDNGFRLIDWRNLPDTGFGQ